MAARLLDGAAVGQADSRRSRARRRGVHRAGGPPARARHRAGRGQPGVRDLRPQQAEVGRRGRAARRPASGCRRRRRSTTLLGVVDRLNRERRVRRHPRAVAAAGGDGAGCGAARVRRDRPGEGRRRLPPGRTSAGSCRTARRSWPARRPASSSCSSGRASRSPARAPSSSGAATSSASRWRCCCCTGTRP